MRSEVEGVGQKGTVMSENVNTVETELLRLTAERLNECGELFANVTFGRLGKEGITLQLCGGEDETRYLDGGRLRVMPLLFLAKCNDQRKAMDTLYRIPDILEQKPPEGVLSVRVTSLPELVDRGEDSVIYEAQCELLVYKTQ